MLREIFANLNGVEKVSNEKTKMYWKIVNRMRNGATSQNFV